MHFIFFSDPHLGVRRQANTTAFSRELLRYRVQSHLVRILSQCREHLAAGSSTICAGDLFDTFTNLEEDILQAAEVCNHGVNMCLAGNHDIRNDATKKASIDVVAKAVPYTRFVKAGYGEVTFHVERGIRTHIVMVPHHSSQDLFEQALGQAMAVAEKAAEGDTWILVTHCNYNLPEVAMTGDTSLNLTDGDVSVLLEVYDYVLLGHEHTPAEYFGGRLKIIGNTFPTNFGDISDKRFLVYDDDTREFSSYQIWNADEGFLRVTPRMLLDTPEQLDIGPGIEFVEVSGDPITPSEVTELNRAISRHLWKPNTDSLLAVRNMARVQRQESEVTESSSDTRKTLSQKIEDSLRPTDMYDLWLDLVSDFKDDISEGEQ